MNFRDEQVRRMAKALEKCDEAVWNGPRYGREAQAAYTASALPQMEKCVEALKNIMAEPYGCPFCDSGKLRNASKEHSDDCLFLLGEQILSQLEPEEKA